MLSFEPNVVVIDDKEDEISGIVDYYVSQGVGIKFFNAHLTNGEAKPSICYSDLNLIFLDVHFTDNVEDYDASICAGWIDSLVSKNTFYILVLWSKETDKKDEILEELKKVNKEPFLFFSEQKTDYQTQEGWNFEQLRESIESKISEYPELEELSNWKKNVKHSSNIVIGHLSNTGEPEDLKKKLQKIIVGHGGKTIIENTDVYFKRETLFEALDSVLISNTKGIIPFKELSETNKEDLYKIPDTIQADIDSKLNSWFHFKLKPLSQENIQHGIICTYKSRLLTRLYNIQDDEHIKGYLSHQLNNSIQPNSDTRLIDICLLMSRPCDIAQNKYGKNLKLMSGVLVKNPLRKNNDRKEFKRGSSSLASIKLYDHLELSDEDNDVAIIFDYRYVFAVPKDMFITKFHNIKIFNKELLSELQVEYSSYSSRLGITQII